MRVALVTIIVASTLASSVFADAYPTFNNESYKLVSIDSDGNVLTVSDGNNFLCKANMTDFGEAFLGFGSCKWIASIKEVNSVRKNAQSEWRNIFPIDNTAQENLLAKSIKLVGCRIDFEENSKIPFPTLNSLVTKMGMTEGAVRYVESSIRTDLFSTIDRLFKSGKVIYVDSMSALELKDCT